MKYAYHSNMYLISYIHNFYLHLTEKYVFFIKWYKIYLFFIILYIGYYFKVKKKTFLYFIWFVLNILYLVIKKRCNAPITWICSVYTQVYTLCTLCTMYTMNWAGCTLLQGLKIILVLQLILFPLFFPHKQPGHLKRIKIFFLWRKKKSIVMFKSN